MLKTEKLKIYNEDECRQLPWHLHGVYILLADNKKPLYVGASLDLRNRLLGHLRGTSKNTKPFVNDIKEVIILPTKYTNKVEVSLIAELDPPINILKRPQWYLKERLEKKEFYRDIYDCLDGDIVFEVNELYEEMEKWIRKK